MALPAHEQGQQRELFRGQVERGAVARDLAAQQVHFQIGDAQYVELARGGCPGDTAARQRQDACEQFRKREWLDQVIVGTIARSLNPVVHGIPRGEHQHGDILFLAQLPQDTDAVHARQHDVQQYEIVFAFRGQMQAGDAIGCHIHDMALLEQCFVQVCAELLLVFYH